MSTAPRVMILDGDYHHSLALGAELKQVLGATVLSVAGSVPAHARPSRHTDVSLTAPHPSEDSFTMALFRLVEKHRPDIIVPVGHASFARVISMANSLPPSVRALIPGSNVFELASSKILTYELARELSIRTPREYSHRELISTRGQTIAAYPVFAKARLERGGASTALLRTEEEYMAFDTSTIGGDAIFQEYINGDSYTFAQNGYYFKGQPIRTFQHVELRSVPRRGGSGTRVRTAYLPTICDLADRLMAALNWTGIAQVEFKRATTGEFVIMEINPKFWASYALASRSGNPIAAAAVAHALGVEGPLSRPGDLGMSMVFPIRELSYAFRNRRQESVLASAVSMIWPPAHLDIELRDVRAHLPARQVRKFVSG